jgi:hypothetical protein
MFNVNSISSEGHRKDFGQNASNLRLTSSRNVDTSLAEDIMTRKRASLAVALGVTGALFWVKSTVPKPEAMAARGEGIDVSELHRDASTTMPSFDDTSQTYIGTLDVLRTYP